MSYTVGADERVVTENRKLFFEKLGLKLENTAYQRQVHGDEIQVVTSGGDCGESDAMITTETNLGIAISTADCCAIFIYDPKNNVIAGVHSGWRGTNQKILSKTIMKLKNEFNSNAEHLICYLSPSISQQNYPVGKEVAEKFDSKYLKSKNGKLYLDVARNNYDMLLEQGIKKNNIQASKLCTFEYSEIFHSYRRDGKQSGRALGVIAMVKD